MNLDGLEYLGELTDGGYVWEKVYYDLNKKEFVKDKFHCGSVDDCAEFYDGREVVSIDELIKQAGSNVDLLSNLLQYGETEKESVIKRIETLTKNDFQPTRYEYEFQQFNDGDSIKYVVVMATTHKPFIMSDFFFIYTNKEKGNSFIAKKSQKYGENQFELLEVSNIKEFFENIALPNGLERFMFNDENRIYSIYNVCSIDSRTDKEVMDELRDELAYEQRSLLVPSVNVDNNSDEKNYRLARRGIILGIVSLILSLISLLFQRTWVCATPILPGIIGFACSHSADSNSFDKKIVRNALVGMALNGCALLIIFMLIINAVN